MYARGKTIFQHIKNLLFLLIIIKWYSKSFYFLIFYFAFLSFSDLFLNRLCRLTRPERVLVASACSWAWRTGRSSLPVGESAGCLVQSFWGSRFLRSSGGTEGCACPRCWHLWSLCNVSPTAHHNILRAREHSSESLVTSCQFLCQYIWAAWAVLDWEVRRSTGRIRLAARRRWI